MTSHPGRLYALALALVAFFLAWAVVAARPWARAAADPRLQQLAVREARLRHEAKLVNRVVAARWTAYRAALRVRESQIAVAKARIAAARAAAMRQAAAATLAAQSAPAAAAAAPAVRVVTLPPLTVTRTS
jgi:hypothetical protein